MIVNPYNELARMLPQTVNYTQLTKCVEKAIDSNVLEHLAPELRTAIDRLDIDEGSYDFLKLMVWGVSASNYSNTIYEILVQFCNRYVNDLDSLSFDPDTYSLAVVFICTDNRVEFLKKLQLDQKFPIGKLIMLRLVCEAPEVVNDPNIESIIQIVIQLIISGMDYNEIFNYLKNDTEFSKPGILEPSINFVMTMSNIMNGINIPEILFTLNRAYFNENLRVEIEFASKRISETISAKVCPSNEDTGKSRIPRSRNTKVSTDDIRRLLKTFILDFVQFSRARNGNPKSDLPNIEMGELIVSLDRSIHEFHRLTEYKDIVVTDEWMGEILHTAYNIFNSCYIINEPAKEQLFQLLLVYTGNDGNTIWYRGDFLKSVKMYYDQDPAFKVFCDEIIEDNCNQIITDIDADKFLYLVHRYTDPVLMENDPTPPQGFLSTATEASKSSREEELDARERELERRERRISEKEKEYGDNDNDNDEEDNEDDSEEEEPQKKLDYDIDASQSTKGYDKTSKKVSSGSRKIYKAFHKYNTSKGKVDSQLDKMLTSAKRAFTGDKTEAILSGKRWTPLELLQRVLTSAAIFSFTKVGGFIYLVTSFALDQRRTEKQRREILGELDTEIKLLEEKIEDARGDGNRQAKYALMRTKGELERARNKIRYNIAASKDDMQTARDIITGKRSSRGRSREEY